MTTTKIIRAIDGGGNGFRSADVSPSGEISNYRSTLPLGSLSELLDFISEEMPAGCGGIAYSIAGTISGLNVVTKSPNIRMLEGVALAKKTVSHTSLPSCVFNDMHSAVTGMAALLPHEPHFLGITWSSGIGLRPWRNGGIVAEAEGGHTVLDSSESAPLCGCGVRGHVEAFLGGHAIRRKVVEITTSLGIPLPPGEPCAFLDAAYLERQEWAVDIYTDIIKHMGLFLANMQSAYNVPLIVWKGTFAKHAFFTIEDAVREVMKGHLMEPEWASPEHLRFAFSPDPQNDALIGAASAFRALKL